MSSKRSTRQLQQIVDELKEAARQLGLQVRVDQGSFRGGHCMVGDDAFIVLNKRHLPEAHLVLLAEALRDRPVDTIYLRPATRQALEDVWQRSGQLEVEADVEE